ncbi:hypothetical protein GPECTOR_2g1133 [Gonium pectorale]|uniref:Methylthioribose-1-phosphate isomerase n=1 Tax=Gonium pectorale TaxID=33097 RepID=A0A150H0Q5_GONPE|nr:hypothetical protein GPECTOR_2g1133 [Gonium pectorale]|eukprot:KXZ55583.1 hypothetical protein GPECTOR_2g1133 [Gonium pectorale]
MTGEAVSALQAIIYSRGRLQLLDQRLLPFQTVYLDVPDVKAAWTQIRDMVVRGAPAIGCTGALAMAVELHANKGAGKDFSSVEETVQFINATLDYLVTSRPTAVNLADAANKLRAVTASASAAPAATPLSVCGAVIEAAEAFLADDIAANKAMGAYGADALLAAAKARGRGVGGRLRVLTHCNTGSLATAGFGTALGVIRALHERGLLEHAFCTETRPYNQGARLTAFELAHDGLPATLICDSAAAALMGTGQVDAVVVGADRVVANGDTANKIGTQSLSIAAAHYGVPFFIAAPTTTLDPALPSGEHIVIEQRTHEELTHFRGQRVAAEGVGVWNPSFDVAPGALIEGIITEKGMVPKQDGAFQVRSFMAQLGLWAQPAGHSAAADHAADAVASGSGSGPAVPRGFRALDLESVKHYVAARPGLQQRVGPADSVESWSVREVGDGNINFVFIVEGPSGSLCIKQALPYVRCVGEDWPLTQDRCRIEAEALGEEAAVCPAHVPALYLYDPAMALIAMHFLAPPHIILRRGLIAGATYPALAAHLADFLAATLFHTSALKLSTTAFRQKIAQFTNDEMCRLTEQVILTEPYITAKNNRWTSPQLDADVAALQSDVAARVAVSELKSLFIGRPQALLHGDLHTGSIMVTDTETAVIDPEFAFVGPMAFDVAKILANLLLAYFSTDGHEAASGQSREAQRAWLLSCMRDIWSGFTSAFCRLWSEHAAAGGDLYPAALVGPEAPAGPATLAACQAAFLEGLWGETVSFMGAFVIRRLVGIAHVADMDSIADPDTRAACERRALRFGRRMLVEGSRSGLGSVAALTEAAEAARAAPSS